VSNIFEKVLCPATSMHVHVATNKKLVEWSPQKRWESVKGPLKRSDLFKKKELATVLK